VLENFDWVPVRVVINNKIQKNDTFHDRSSECGNVADEVKALVIDISFEVRRFEHSSVIPLISRLLEQHFSLIVNFFAHSFVFPKKFFIFFTHFHIKYNKQSINITLFEHSVFIHVYILESSAVYAE